MKIIVFPSSSNWTRWFKEKKKERKRKERKKGRTLKRNKEK